MPTIKGDKTKTLFLKTESHKLHQEFEVKAGASIIKGTPVKLHTDGTVEPMAVDDAAAVMVGISMHSRDAGELVTVAVRGYQILYALSAADAQTAGPVKFGAVPTADGEYPKFANVAGDGTEDAEVIGWAIDAGDEDDTIRVLIKD